MWRFKIGKLTFPENWLTRRLDNSQDGLSLSRNNGESYEAKVDGTENPVTRNADADTVSLKWVNGRTLEQTRRKAGKVLNVARMRVSRDGRLMTIWIEDKQGGTILSYVERKQVGP